MFIFLFPSLLQVGTYREKDIVNILVFSWYCHGESRMGRTSCIHRGREKKKGK